MDLTQMNHFHCQKQDELGSEFLHPTGKNYNFQGNKKRF